jgi:hypothetical protein
MDESQKIGRELDKKRQHRERLSCGLLKHSSRHIGTICAFVCIYNINNL